MRSSPDSQKAKGPGSSGTWVKRRRKSLDLTQQELATLVGCSDALIFKIEATRSQTRSVTLEMIAKDLLDLWLLFLSGQIKFIVFDSCSTRLKTERLTSLISQAAILTKNSTILQPTCPG